MTATDRPEQAEVSRRATFLDRVSHHEPLVRDFPLPGQKDRHGHPLRASGADGHAARFKVARLLDRNLAASRRQHHRPSILARRP